MDRKTGSADFFCFSKMMVLLRCENDFLKFFWGISLGYLERSDNHRLSLPIRLFVQDTPYKLR
jgi:hypothetical protein